MKRPLTVPMPELRNDPPEIGRTTLIVELDIDRAIAGEAFDAPSLMAPERARPTTIEFWNYPTWISSN